MSAKPSCAIGSLHIHGRTRFESCSFEPNEPAPTESFSRFIDSNINSMIDDPTRITTTPIIIIIEHWRKEFEGHLLRSFPLFPCQLLAALAQSERSTSYSLPSFDAYRSEIKYTGYHIGVLPPSSAQGEGGYLHLGNKICFSAPIVVYTRKLADANVVFLIGGSIAPNFISSVTRHYCEDSCRRWERLGSNMMYLIPDLFYLFTDWDSTLFALKAVLRDAEARSMSQSLPVTVHTRLLHHQISNVTELRESLRFHQAVIEQTLDSQEEWGLYSSLNSRSSFENRVRRGNQFIIRASLESQLQRMRGHMAHNAITLDTIKDQFANLIQLDFNLAAVSEGQSVSRLSSLAFIYIPLTYVATLLAIPDIGIQPIWYPLIAVPLLFLSIFVAFLNDRLAKNREKRISSSNHDILNSPKLLKLPFKWRNGRSLADVEVGEDQSTEVAQPAMSPRIASSPISPLLSLTSPSLEYLPRFFRNAELLNDPTWEIERTSKSSIELSDLPGPSVFEAQEKGDINSSSASIDANMGETSKIGNSIVKEQLENRLLSRILERETSSPEETPSARPYLDRSDAGVASIVRSSYRRGSYR